MASSARLLELGCGGDCSDCGGGGGGSCCGPQGSRAAALLAGRCARPVGGGGGGGGSRGLASAGQLGQRQARANGTAGCGLPAAAARAGSQPSESWPEAAAQAARNNNGPGLGGGERQQEQVSSSGGQTASGKARSKKSSGSETAAGYYSKIFRQYLPTGRWRGATNSSNHLIHLHRPDGRQQAQLEEASNCKQQQQQQQPPPLDSTPAQISGGGGGNYSRTAHLPLASSGHSSAGRDHNQSMACNDRPSAGLVACQDTSAGASELDRAVIELQPAAAAAAAARKREQQTSKYHSRRDEKEQSNKTQQRQDASGSSSSRRQGRRATGESPLLPSQQQQPPPPPPPPASRRTTSGGHKQTGPAGRSILSQALDKLSKSFASSSSSSLSLSLSNQQHNKSSPTTPTGQSWRKSIPASESSESLVGGAASGSSKQQVDANNNDDDHDDDYEQHSAQQMSSQRRAHGRPAGPVAMAPRSPRAVSKRHNQQARRQPDEEDVESLIIGSNRSTAATRAKAMQTTTNTSSKPSRPSGLRQLVVPRWVLAFIVCGLVLLAGSQPARCLQQGPPFAASRSQQPPLQQLAGDPLPPPPPPLRGLQAPPNQQQQQQQPPPPPQGAARQQQQQQPAAQPGAGSLVANINCNKIRGHVTLTPNLQGGTTVTTQISAGPPGEVYQWSVHQFPVKPGAAMCTCSPLILGLKLIDLSEMHGNLPSEQEFSVQSATLQLFGPESPVGHSLLLRGLKTGMLACATFLPTSRKSNYRAKFHAPISGSVSIFQTAFGTSFVSHLMYANGTRRHSVHRFDLVKSEDDNSGLLLTTTSGGGSGGHLGPSVNSAVAALEQREHEHELGACRKLVSQQQQQQQQQQLAEPLFRNLSYQLAVSTENFGMRGRTALVLPPIPFETFASVQVVIYSEWDPMEPIACAPLRFVKPKTAAAKFQAHSVQGSVVFSQESPYDVTVARVNLQFPNSDGHSYGIDELPMIIRRKSDTRVCPNIREIIYNPHHIEPSSVPAEGEATSDQYAVGDLSGKYGSLTGKAAEKLQVNDYNLPLFGPASIVGRAMTIYSADGVAIACSNVELTTPMTTAFATFDYGIQGQFIFRQPANDCNGDTYVYIEVSKPTVGGGGGHGSGHSLLAAAAAPPAPAAPPDGRSMDHNWHIHANPVDSGLEHLSTTECAPAGPHYNPYNTSTASIYSRDCTPFNVLRCELGDLSSKMFTIEIPPYRVKGPNQEPDIGKFFGTDIDLPLCGPASVVNRSVVVHGADFGHQRLACSTVIEFKARN